MKKILIASMILAGCAVGAKAQEVSKDSAGVTTTHSTTETQSSAAVQDGEIKSQDLPDAVKKTLDSPSYKGWIINAASYDKKKDHYVVELKNGADMKKVKFNKEGKVVND